MNQLKKKEFTETILAQEIVSRGEYETKIEVYYKCMEMEVARLTT